MWSQSTGVWDRRTDERHARSTINWQHAVYIVDSREQAFVQSLSTAVLVQAVSKACSSGLSSHCSCGPVPNEPLPSDQQSEQFQWGGCPDDLPHGLAFSRAFEQTAVSARKRRRVSRKALINQHNSDVGRQVRTARPCEDSCCIGQSARYRPHTHRNYLLLCILTVDVILL